jgi:nicotinate-nucleotide--dimethylbenzimidazole phosphoribosyltransferase
MIERQEVRLWFSMIATAGGVPAFVLVTWTIWFVCFDLAPPTMLVAAPRHSSGLVQAKGTIPPPSAAKPVVAPLTAQTPKPLSTMPMAGDAPAYADPAQPVLAQAEAPTSQVRQQPTEVVAAPPDAKESAVASAPPTVAPPMAGDAPANADPAQPILVQAKAPTPQVRQQPTEFVAAAPDAKASVVASAPPTVAPPMAGDAPAYPDAAQDISIVVSSVMPVQPAALEPSEPIEGPIPLPRPKPRVVVAHVSRAASLARSPTVASSRRPSSHAAKSVNARERDRFP